MKKSISFILVLSMLLAAMLGVTTAAEESAPQKLDITHASLEFGNAVYPLFAVDYTDVYTGTDAEAKAKQNIKVEVYNGSTLIETLSPSDVDGVPEGTIAFKQTNIGLKNMGDVFTYKAVNGKAENASDPVEYSVLEYALMVQSDSDAKLNAVIDAMIEVGAAAQASFDYKAYDYDLTKKYSIVTLLGGATFQDGTSKKIIAEGDPTVYVASPGFQSDKVVWYDSNLKMVSSNSTLELQGGASGRYFAIPAAQIVDAGTGHIKSGTTQVEPGFNAAVLGIIGDFVNKGDKDAENTFTISFTLATNVASDATLELYNAAYMSTGELKNVNQTTDPTKCRVSLWRASKTKGYMGTRYGNNGKGVAVHSSNVVCQNLAPLSVDVPADSIGEYVSVSIVFDLSGEADCIACTSESGCDSCNFDGVQDGKAIQMRFYVNGVEKMRTILPVRFSYVAADGTTRRYFDENLTIKFSSFTNMYYKNFIVTPGDINSYR